MYCTIYCNYTTVLVQYTTVLVHYEHTRMYGYVLYVSMGNRAARSVKEMVIPFHYSIPNQ